VLTSLALATAAAIWLQLAGSASPGFDRSSAAQAAFEQETGIRVLRVAVTAGGGLVDFRYQVVDPDKALVVHDDPPVLVDEKTGAVIDTPFMGHSHSGQPKAGHTYPVLLVNEQGLIGPGDTVTVVVGDSRLEHVGVQ
jgi:hypothetical protein